jgi:glycerol-3-phosphate dehydrogenase (NAD(P)+)
MQYGIIGSGSWATALAKILTDNKQAIHWLVRTNAMSDFISRRKHNPNYLSSAVFNTDYLRLSTEIIDVVAASDHIIIATPSAYVMETLQPLSSHAFGVKKIISAVKGILPQQNILLNDFLEKEYRVEQKNYFTIMGPCHAEEIAAEKLSYLTFSGAAEYRGE